MGAKYSYKWCEYFADQASTILEKKFDFFGGCPSSARPCVCGGTLDFNIPIGWKGLIEAGKLFTAKPIHGKTNSRQNQFTTKPIHDNTTGSICCFN